MSFGTVLPRDMWLCIIDCLDTRTFSAIHCVSKIFKQMAIDMRVCIINNVMIYGFKKLENMERTLSMPNRLHTNVTLLTQHVTSLRLLCIIATYIRNSKNYDAKKYINYSNFINDIPQIIDNAQFCASVDEWVRAIYRMYGISTPLHKSVYTQYERYREL